MRAIEAFHFFKMHIERDIGKHQIVEFISSIHPVKTNLELIRVGGSGDGGYLIPDDLSGVNYLFSPGVSTKISFESELADRGIKCFLADYSVSLSPSIKGNVNFMKKFVGILDNETDISIETWMNQCIGSDESDCILQMDIEGAEYNVLEKMIEDGSIDYINTLFVEWHDYQMKNKEIETEKIKAILKEKKIEYIDWH